MTSKELTRPQPRTQTITGPSKHELQALLREEKAAGRIGPNTSDIMPIAGGRMWAVKVVRLADPPPAWRRRAWVGAGATSALAVICAMAWHARYVLGALALTVAGVALAVWLLGRGSHSRANHCCLIVVHRKGCRG